MLVTNAVLTSFGFPAPPVVSSHSPRRRIREYNAEQARLTMMAVMAPILGHHVSKLWSGYKARQRVKVLEAKRRKMRLLIKIQTRLRMILARNRRRVQRVRAQEWRAAKVVQRSWRGKAGRGILSSDDLSVIDKFGGESVRADTPVRLRLC